MAASVRLVAVPFNVTAVIVMVFLLDFCLDLCGSIRPYYLTGSELSRLFDAGARQFTAMICRETLPTSVINPRYGAQPMPYANNNGTRIHYEVEGVGPPLLLQHGTTGSWEDWAEFGYAQPLRKEYRLILVDARGSRCKRQASRSRRL